jgi:flavin-binding protein dodecin
MRGDIMAVAKVVELIGSSNKSLDDAVKNTLKEASKTIRGIKELWVSDFKVLVEDNKIVEYRVNVKLTFLVESER